MRLAFLAKAKARPVKIRGVAWVRVWTMARWLPKEPARMAPKASMGL
jgi:hypothetical protein